MIEASIIIPTFRRPDALRRAIGSCIAQQGVTDAFEIVVADNNPDGSARPVVDELAAGTSIPVRYTGEPRPGISYARNAGIAAASGRYVAFLDDDEAAEPGWLAAHLATIRRFEADVVVGPVRADFPPGFRLGKAYPYNQFARDLELPTGAPMPRMVGIGNTMLRRSSCIAGPEPFDPRFGLIGGEDVVFIRRLMLRGRKMVWCAEAAVREPVPEYRLEPRFLLRRAFVRGQVTTFASAAVPLRLEAARMMLVGCAQALLFGGPALVLRALKNPRWVRWMDHALLGVGKVLWHPRLQRSLYR